MLGCEEINSIFQTPFQCNTAIIGLAVLRGNCIIRYVETARKYLTMLYTLYVVGDKL